MGPCRLPRGGLSLAPVAKTVSPTSIELLPSHRDMRHQALPWAVQCLVRARPALASVPQVSSYFYRMGAAACAVAAATAAATGAVGCAQVCDMAVQPPPVRRPRGQTPTPHAPALLCACVCVPSFTRVRSCVFPRRQPRPLSRLLSPFLLLPEFGRTASASRTCLPCWCVWLERGHGFLTPRAAAQRWSWPRASPWRCGGRACGGVPGAAQCFGA
jgi:hypothetical protein